MGLSVYRVFFLNNVNCCDKTKNKSGWYHSQGLYRGQYRKRESELCSSKYAFIFDQSYSDYVQLLQVPSGLTCLQWRTVTKNVSRTSPISPKLFLYWIFYHSHRNATRTTFITVFISNSKIHLREQMGKLNISKFWHLQFIMLAFCTQNTFLCQDDSAYSPIFTTKQ